MVARGVTRLCGHEARATVLGYLQRGGSPTPFDRILGTQFGVEAVHAIAGRHLSTMVALRGVEVITVPLAEAVAEPKLVSPDSQLIRTAKGVGIVFG